MLERARRGCPLQAAVVIAVQECFCCRETYMNRREIQLQDCFDPNGQKLYGADGSMTIFLEEPQDCSCHKCGG